jgi:hypothetical protein
MLYLNFKTFMRVLPLIKHGLFLMWWWCEMKTSLPIENNVDTSISTPKGYVGFKCSAFNVG